MKAVYLTKGSMDIFDRLENYEESFSKIIYGLITSMNRTDVKSYDRVIIGKNKLTPELLKEVLGDLVSDKDYKNFADKYNSRANNEEAEKETTDMGYNKKQSIKNIETSPSMIKFTDDFWTALDKIKPNSQVVWSIWELDSNPSIKNKLGITEVDISDKEFYFNVKTTGGKPGKMKIGEFLRHFFGNKLSKDEISSFIHDYNKVVGAVTGRRNSDEIITPREFKFEPKNVKETFLSLVTETYPYGHEEELIPFLPQDLLKDTHGNYYKIIGKSDTAFTCHLDTASSRKSAVTLIEKKIKDDTYIQTDGTSILGADDKAGVAVMLYMMAHEVPGVYWFFLGEERGGIGSGKVSMDYDDYPFMRDIKKMVSFDRRNYYSVITEQMGVTCCSNEFAESLCEELNKHGMKLNLDPTGIFTDSANFIEQIPECTNISVGYFDEHTHQEIQNITYLEKLAKACASANWSKLVVKRKIGFDDDILRKYSRLIKGFKRSIFYNTDSISGFENKLVIDLEISDVDTEHFYKDLLTLNRLLDENKIEADIKFDEDHIKIVLN